MDANTIRLTEQRDEAQSQVRSLETDLRILRSALASVTRERDEAVALLRDVTDIALAYVPKSSKDHRTFTANISRAFLSRLSAPTGDGGAR